MKARERVLRALNHQEVDRVPIDFGGTVVTCLDAQAHRQLKQYMHLSNDDPGPIIDYTMGTVAPTEEIMCRFDVDCRRVALNYGTPAIQDNMYMNGFGMRYRKAVPHEYYDVIANPLTEAKIEDLDRMQLPNPDEPSIYFGLREQARDLYENSPYCVIADFGVPGFYETCQKLRGYEQFAVDMLLNEDLVTALFDRLLELQKRFFANYLAAVGPYTQVIGYADDLGMQDRLQMSPALYRKILKPYHKEIFSFIKSQADVKILLHSCGAIVPIIDDLIEIGLDALNPVQTNATGMEPQLLKEKFGDRICFWGGLDEQQLLPYGTPAQIEGEVRSLMRVLGKGSGYVFAASHNIQADTSAENVVAMWEAAKRFR